MRYSSSRKFSVLKSSTPSNRSILARSLFGPFEGDAVVLARGVIEDTTIVLLLTFPTAALQNIRFRDEALILQSVDTETRQTGRTAERISQ